MDIKLFHIRDYYTVKRITEEQVFVAELNKSNLFNLVSPALNKIVEQLYLKITKGLNTIEFNSLILNGADIDKKLTEILTQNEVFKKFNGDADTSKLFTNAFLKLCRRIFIKDGLNDEMYLVQSYIHNWLEDNLATVIAKDERFSSYDMTNTLMNQLEMLHYFYNTFKRELDNKWIEGDATSWINVENNTDNILEGIRTFDKDYFKGYEAQLNKYKTYSPWKYTFESTRFSDHAMLSDEYSFKNIVLFEKNISLWLKFWNNLKFPVLQDLPFHYLSYPNDILNIAKELLNQKDSLKSSREYLACILLKNLFESSLRVQENLTFYNDEARLNSLSEREKNGTVISKGKELFSQWEEKKVNIYKETIKTLLGILSIEQMEEWAFSYKPRASIRGDYDTMHNKEIETLLNAFNPHIKTEPFEVQIKSADEKFNLQKFVFLVSRINEDNNKVNAGTLLTIITNYIRSEQFYWDGTFSPAYWPSIKGVAVLLSLLENPIQKAEELVRNFKAIHEGWNTSPHDYKITQREAFIFCGAILLLEHGKIFKDKKERNYYFNYLLNLLISQTRFSVINKDNDYKMPLYLLNLVVNQIYTDLKKIYESEIINNIDNINTVIEILSNEGYQLSKPSILLLKNRIKNEFPFEKEKFIQRGQTHEIENIEMNIKKLVLENGKKNNI